MELERNGEQSDDDVREGQVGDEVVGDGLHPPARQYDADHQTVAWKNGDMTK